jgi:hypothetical protein
MCSLLSTGPMNLEDILPPFSPQQTARTPSFFLYRRHRSKHFSSDTRPLVFDRPIMPNSMSSLANAQETQKLTLNIPR